MMPADFKSTLQVNRIYLPASKTVFLSIGSWELGVNIKRLWVAFFSAEDEDEGKCYRVTNHETSIFPLKRQNWDYNQVY